MVVNHHIALNTKNSAMIQTTARNTHRMTNIIASMTVKMKSIISCVFLMFVLQRYDNILKYPRDLVKK